jgi:histone H3/H4
MARRGGVKRISAQVYEETRQVLKNKLTEVCTLLVGEVWLFAKLV